MAKIASLVLAVMAGLLTCGQQQNNPEVFTLQFLCSIHSLLHKPTYINFKIYHLHERASK